MPAADWSRLWKRAGWLRRLSGRMPSPSEAEHGAALWMASLAASRVSPTASPESAPAQTTSVTSGATPGASSSRPAPGSSSSRTSPECSPRSPARFRERSESAETYTAWVSRLRADFSARKSWASAMSASGSSSSAPGASARPTPQTRDHKGANQDELIDWGNARPLNETAVIWARNGGSNWPTPKVSDLKGADLARAENRSGARHPGDGLATTVAKWPTPRTITGGAESAERKRELGRLESGGGDLQVAARQWCTPSVAISTGGQSSRSGDRQGEELLAGQARSLFTHLDPMTSTPGEPSSPSAPNSPPLSLNPIFVGWLMGWIVPASTNSGLAEMGSFHWSVAMRSALSQLASPPAAPPAQADLFA